MSKDNLTIQKLNTSHIEDVMALQDTIINGLHPDEQHFILHRSRADYQKALEGKSSSMIGIFDGDKLIAQGVATPNGEERNALYAQMEKVVAEDCVWLPISHAQVLSAYNPLVDGYYYHKTAVVFFSEMSKPAK